jgi:cytochrome c biogenesis factor
MKALLIVTGVVLALVSLIILLGMLAASPEFMRTARHTSVGDLILTYAVFVVLALVPGALGVLAIRAGIRR